MFRVKSFCAVCGVDNNYLVKTFSSKPIWSLTSVLMCEDSQIRVKRYREMDMNVTQGKVTSTRNSAINLSQPSSLR